MANEWVTMWQGGGWWLLPGSSGSPSQKKDMINIDLPAPETTLCATLRTPNPWSNCHRTVSPVSMVTLAPDTSNPGHRGTRRRGGGGG